MNRTTCNLSASWLEEISENVRPTITMTLISTLLASAVNIGSGPSGCQLRAGNPQRPRGTSKNSGY
jgi:hypothetical protein